ncbi:hypothetical protein AVEN_5023-1 [Araneus ventricosus]|uniref:Uncharacterized protein n=1 Tax=Araneus ventricosus TaxID=182803 RepID=A0A4Y2S5Z5_ARAVE|nr:hypothetical protein AVEN_5023-1 [Araneus ventricosus]
MQPILPQDCRRVNTGVHLRKACNEDGHDCINKRNSGVRSECFIDICFSTIEIFKNFRLILSHGTQQMTLLFMIHVLAICPLKYVIIYMCIRSSFCGIGRKGPGSFIDYLGT